MAGASHVIVAAGKHNNAYIFLDSGGGGVLTAVPETTVPWYSPATGVDFGMDVITVT